MAKSSAHFIHQEELVWCGRASGFLPLSRLIEDVKEAVERYAKEQPLRARTAAKFAFRRPQPAIAY